jgi:hypothetical protein
MAEGEHHRSPNRVSRPPPGVPGTSWKQGSVHENNKGIRACEARQASEEHAWTRIRSQT